MKGGTDALEGRGPVLSVMTLFPVCDTQWQYCVTCRDAVAPLHSLLVRYARGGWAEAHKGLGWGWGGGHPNCFTR